LTKVDDGHHVAMSEVVFVRVDDSHRVSPHDGHVDNAGLNVEIALVVNPSKKQALALAANYGELCLRVQADMKGGPFARGGGAENKCERGK
jgi:hypothetical protein